MTATSAITKWSLKAAGDNKDKFFKGTVARDFLPLVFSTNRPHVVPEFTPENIFEFFFKFAEIFVFECCSTEDERHRHRPVAKITPPSTLLPATSRAQFPPL